MTKKQKFFLIFSGLLMVTALTMFMSSVFGNRTIFNLWGLLILMFFVAHALLFLMAKHNKKKRWVIYLPTIGVSLIALFFGIIAIINYESNSQGMNEDYSGIFAIILTVVSIFSGSYAFVFDRLWLKNNQ